MTPEGVTNLETLRDRLYRYISDPLEKDEAKKAQLRTVLARIPKMSTGPNRGITSDPSPSGPQVTVEGVGLDVMDPMTKPLQALSTFNQDMRTAAGAIGGGEMLAGSALKAIPRLAGSALGRIGGAAAEGGLISGGATAYDTAARGGTAGEAASAGASAIPLGVAMGGGAQTVGEALTGAGRLMLKTKGAKARALIEGYGGKVSAKDSGSGLPELEGLGKVTDDDIGFQARKSGEKLIEANDTKFDTEGRQPYQSGIDAMDESRLGKRMVDIAPLKDKMAKVAYHSQTDPATKSFLLGQIDEIEKHFVDPKTGLVLAPESWVNGKTSMLWERADPTKLATGAGSVQDAKIASVAREGQKLREQGPYNPMNEKYAAAKADSGEFRKAMGLTPEPTPNEAVDERRIANFLARGSQKTITSGIQRGAGGGKRLAELLDARPELQRTVDAPNIVRAKADLQFGLGDEVGGFMERSPKRNLLHLGLHNASAATGRVLYGPAQGAQAAGQAIAPTVNPLVAAAQAQQQLEQQQMEEQQRQLDEQARLTKQHQDSAVLGLIFTKAPKPNSE